MTTTDFQRICDALGLVPWKVALAAETGRSYAEVDDALAERQSLKDAGSSDPL